MPQKHKHNGGLSKRRVLLEKFREETSPLLSTETLGTRISQIDRIIQRKASNALFSLETTNEDSKSVSRRSHRLERMAEEFLYRVQARRKRARSYCYLLWFLMLFITFLSTQFLKEDNRNLFTVDKSIKTRVVNILPKGNLNADADFYNWLSATVLDIFKPTVCGNGVCEGPDEYPGFGRFGCQEDCGRHFNRTTLRIDLAPVWEAPSGPLAELRGRAVFGAGTSLPVGFSYNVYSETMRDYIFLNNSAERWIAPQPEPFSQPLLGLSLTHSDFFGTFYSRLHPSILIFPLNLCFIRVFFSSPCRYDSIGPSSLTCPTECSESNCIKTSSCAPSCQLV
mmetsp:Transcript_53306/g.111239  ORF Transcript_53306/g.111239 Transcript_53306/m.111239 type:complete len:338 (-) Transcript_53306:4223-5236(-)